MTRERREVQLSDLIDRELEKMDRLISKLPQTAIDIMDFESTYTFKFERYVNCNLAHYKRYLTKFLHVHENLPNVCNYSFKIKNSVSKAIMSSTERAHSFNMNEEDSNVIQVCEDDYNDHLPEDFEFGEHPGFTACLAVNDDDMIIWNWTESAELIMNFGETNIYDRVVWFIYATYFRIKCGFYWKLMKLRGKCEEYKAYDFEDGASSVMSIIFDDGDLLSDYTTWRELINKIMSLKISIKLFSIDYLIQESGRPYDED